MYLPSSATSSAALSLSTTAAIHLASTYLAITSTSDSDDGDDSKVGSYSSFIGIVTALVGNVLISFALNIQRYAHIRIDREAHAAHDAEVLDNGPEEEGIQIEGQIMDGAAGPLRNYGTGNKNENGGIASSNVDGLSEEQDVPGEESRLLNGTNDDDEDTPLKKSFQSNRSDSSDKSWEGERKSYLTSPYWWAGIILMCVGETGNFLAYGFAPASIVSPLGVVALVSNCVIAPVMLKEQFRKRDFLGVLVAIAGAVTVVLSASKEEAKLGPDELWGAITRWEFELYLGLTAGAIIALMWASGKYGDRSILIDLGLVGLFGGYTALSTKGVASLLSYSWWKIVTFPISYLLAAVLIGTALMQIRHLNRALQNFDSTMVIPTQFVLFTISVIVGSAVLYRDFESADKDQFGKFIGGCAMTFLGVYLITSGRASQDDGDASDDEAAGDRQVRIYDQDGLDQNKSASRRSSLRLQTAGSLLRDPSQLSPLIDEEDEDMDPERPFTPRNPLSRAVTDTSVTPSISVTQSRSPPESPQRSPIQFNASNPLLVNPWRTENGLEEESGLQPAFSSSPRTPQSQSRGRRASANTATAARPKTPNESRSRPSSPRKQGQQRPPLTPSQSSRNSLSSRLAPGPFLSPLSSSLSGVIAESLRRGEGTPERTRRRWPGLRSVGRSGRNRDGVADLEAAFDDLDPEGENSIRRKRSEAALRRARTNERSERSERSGRNRSLSDNWPGLSWFKLGSGLSALTRGGKSSDAPERRDDFEDADADDDDHVDDPDGGRGLPPADRRGSTS